jgi:hypothetical protein
VILPTQEADRDQEDCGSKLRTGGVAQGVGPECKPQYHKKKERERKEKKETKRIR